MKLKIALLMLIVLIAGYFFRYSYKTAYACIYRIDNFTNAVYQSCGAAPWELIQDKVLASEFLDRE